MFLQLQKDPKTGFFVVNKGTHGYHPGRHLQHQLQQRQLQHNPARAQPPQQQVIFVNSISLIKDWIFFLVSFDYQI